MKPPRFRYEDPSDLATATQILSAEGDDAKILAGGQSLMPVVNMRLARPAVLVNINRLTELDYVKRDNGTLRIGALTRHDTLMTSQEVREACPLISEAMPYVGHLAIRYRGTIGGSIVHADPSAELPALAVALDADMVLTSSRGSRTVSAEEFFLTFFTTAAEPDEILTEIVVPVQPTGSRSVVKEIARRHGDFALAGVAAELKVSGGRIERARLSAFGVDDVPRRLSDAENVLAGAAPSGEAFDAAAQAATEAVEPESDMHASAEYRREMVGLLLRRALVEASGSDSD